MELLSEVQTPAQLLNFALSREQEQENQREILRNSAPNWNNQVSAVTNNTPRDNSNNQHKKQTKTKNSAGDAGGIVLPGHMNKGVAKQAKSSICKETGHFAKMCRSKIPLLPVRRNQTRGKYQRPQGKGNSQLRVRQIQENLMEEDQMKQIFRSRSNTIYQRADRGLGGRQSYCTDNV